MLKRQLAFLSFAVSCSLATYIHTSTDESKPVEQVTAMKMANQAAAATSVASDRSEEMGQVQKLRQLADSLYIGKLRKGTQAHHTLHALFVEWGAAEPHSAMAYLEQAPLGIQRFSQAVLRGWAQSDDIANAKAWIETNISPTLSAPYYEAMLDGLDDIGHSQRALQFALNSGTNAQAPLARHAIENWTTRDLPAATLWIEQTEANLSEDLRAGVLSGYARAWSRQSPQAASDWALSLPSGHTRATVLSAAVDSWIQTDSSAAGYWIFSQEKDDAIEAILSNNAHQISHVNPSAAFEFIENDPLNEEDPYRMSGHLIMALDNVMRKAPAASVPWIKRVEAQTLAAASEGLTHSAYQVPKKSYVEMIDRWAAEDEQAAFSYLENANQLDESERREIERRALDRLQTTDPEKAAYYLLKRWKDSDQANAMEYAETLPQMHWDISVSNFKTHYQMIAEAWAKSEPEKVGFYLERQEVLAPEETAELLVAIQPFES